MKNTHLLIGVGVVVCLAACYVFATNHWLHGHGDGHHEDVPEGYHKMEDGSLMKNGDHEEVKELSPKSSIDSTSKQSITLDPTAKVFALKGVNYAYDAKEIRVKKGETVTINFESTDGFHDVVIDEFNARTKKVQPGTPTSMTFVADRVGTFEYYCSVGSHRANGMVGNLVVEE